MIPIARVAATVAVLGAVAVPMRLDAQDWPQWRGPNRDGVAPSAAQRGAWPDALTRAWKVDVGVGHSSPVVVANRVYAFSRQGDQETVACLDLTTGKQIWRQSYAAPYTMNPAAAGHGPGPKSTPVVADGRVFTFGISGILSAFDAATGAVKWRKTFTDYKQTSPDFGAAMSPLVDRGLLIVHVGGHDKGGLTALDASTGAVRWVWAGDGPAYASPVAAEFGGVRHVVTQSEKFVIGVDEATGALLWRIPLKTDYDQNSVTPLVYQQTVIVSGLSIGVTAYRPVRNGDAWTPERVWHTTGVSMYMNSPVLRGDLVFGLSHRNKGEFFCLDAKTGAVKWTSEPRQGENAAMVVSGDMLLALTTDSELLVARAHDKGFEVVKKYDVADSAVWAHPVVLAQGVLVKDQTSLVLWKF